MRKRRFTKLWFRQYHLSNSVKDLKAMLGARSLKLVNSNFVKERGQILVNWGSSAPLPGCDLNYPEAVAVAANKLLTFEALKDKVIVPEWTKDIEVAKTWNETVVGRDTATGRAGQGITVYQKGVDIGEHLFYTKYFRKKRELRIHVFNGKIIFEQEKMKRKGVENVNKYVRSHDNGWIFGFRHLADDPVPHGVRIAAISAIKYVGLDFGAVDIGWNPDEGPCVFELNTAPGLEGSSLEAYANAFHSLMVFEEKQP